MTMVTKQIKIVSQDSTVYTFHIKNFNINEIIIIASAWLNKTIHGHYLVIRWV